MSTKEKQSPSSTGRKPSISQVATETNSADEEVFQGEDRLMEEQCGLRQISMETTSSRVSSSAETGVVKSMIRVYQANQSPSASTGTKPRKSQVTTKTAELESNRTSNITDVYNANKDQTDPTTASSRGSSSAESDVVKSMTTRVYQAKQSPSSTMTAELEPNRTSNFTDVDTTNKDQTDPTPGDERTGEAVKKPENETEEKNEVEMKKAFVRTVEVETKKEEEKALRDQIKLELRDEIELELRDKIESELRDKLESELRNKIESELRGKIELQMRTKILEEQRRKILGQLPPELRRMVKSALQPSTSEDTDHQQEYKSGKGGRVRGPIKEPDRTTLMINIPILVQVITEPDLILESLCARGVFDRTDRETVQRETRENGNKVGVTELLNLLLDCGSDALQLFGHCLKENNYNEALKLLERTDKIQSELRDKMQSELRDITEEEREKSQEELLDLLTPELKRQVESALQPSTSKDTDQQELESNRTSNITDKANKDQTDPTPASSRGSSSAETGVVKPMSTRAYQAKQSPSSTGTKPSNLSQVTTMTTDEGKLDATEN